MLSTISARAFPLVGLAALGVALVACGDSGSGGTGAGGNGGASAGASMTTSGSSTSTGGGTGCTITLSGAVSKTMPCTVSGGFDATNGKSGIPIVSTTTSIGGAPEASFAIDVDGELSAKTYAWADSIDQGGSVVESATSAYTVSEKDGKGSSSFTLSDVTVKATNGASKIYDVHGTVTATLDPVGAATGSVAMTITF